MVELADSQKWVPVVRDHYYTEKKKYLENCIACGLCAQECPVLDQVELGFTSQEIQEEVLSCLQQGKINKVAQRKAFLCMECFKCVEDICPENLNPLLINELIKGLYHAANPEAIPYGLQSAADSTHRVVATALVSGAEYHKITTEKIVEDSSIVFFPGCNVYLQPEKILQSLDIMDAIGRSYSFLPGLDNCCGDSHFFLGEMEQGAQLLETMMENLLRIAPDVVVLWCPTCLCRFEKQIGSVSDLGFTVISFTQYVAANLERLNLRTLPSRKIRLHRPCKSVFTDLDPDSAESVVAGIPGVSSVTVESETACCGSGAFTWYPEVGEKTADMRVQRGVVSGADEIVTVCHFCAQAMNSSAEEKRIGLTNFVTLLAEALGCSREDKFLQYSRLGDIDGIMEQARECVADSPFDETTVRTALHNVFVK